MNDIKNPLGFNHKSIREKRDCLLKPYQFVKLSEEEKEYISKCKSSKTFSSNQIMHKNIIAIYEKYFPC